MSDHLPLFAGVSETALKQWLAGHGYPAFRAAQVLGWFWDKKVRAFDDMANLPAALRRQLGESFSTAALDVLEVRGREGATRKFLSRLRDGQCIESVLIPAAESEQGARAQRLTLCVSSQVGCAFGCRFCASGLLGLTRNLATGEIVSQVLAAAELTGRRVDNIVFMGMGEPLANDKHLVEALDILTSPVQGGIGARHITVSTSGHVPNLLKLARYPKQIRLAVSLHGASDAVRSAIMPVNNKWPVAALREALVAWSREHKQMISLEYILIDSVNDRPQDADDLIRFCRGLPVKVNLIPYNTVEGLEWARPPLARCTQFRENLAKEGIPATMRYEKGHDIDAACGQLRLRKLKEGQR